MILLKLIQYLRIVYIKFLKEKIRPYLALMNNKITSYFTLSKLSISEYKEKGSKFIAIAFPIENKYEFETELSNIKDKFPKATHYCYAYKLDLDNNNYRINDDGEPSGTAGKPIFGQIESNLLTFVAIVVVRYFGGTKLGVTGLIQSYKNAAILAIKENMIIEKLIETRYILSFEESQYNSMQVCLGQIKKIASQIIYIDLYQIEIVIPITFEFRLKQIVFENLFGFNFDMEEQHRLKKILILKE